MGYPYVNAKGRRREELGVSGLDVLWLAAPALRAKRSSSPESKTRVGNLVERAAVGRTSRHIRRRCWARRKPQEISRGVEIEFSKSLKSTYHFRYRTKNGLLTMFDCFYALKDDVPLRNRVVRCRDAATKTRRLAKMRVLRAAGRCRPCFCKGL